MISFEAARAKVIEVFSARVCAPERETLDLSVAPAAALGPHSRRKHRRRPQLSAIQSFDSRWFCVARRRRGRAGREVAPDRRKPRRRGIRWHGWRRRMRADTDWRARAARRECGRDARIHARRGRFRRVRASRPRRAVLRSRGRRSARRRSRGPARHAARLRRACHGRGSGPRPHRGQPPPARGDSFHRRRACFPWIRHPVPFRFATATTFRWPRR